MKPKSERDCPFCQTDHLGTSKALLFLPVPWPQIKGRGGRKKHISTARYFCPNPNCAYFGETDERVHALVGDGRHGKYESIQDFFCQACHTKFTARRNTVQYRLKTPSQTIERILWLLALGVEISALEEVFGISDGTIRTWLCRRGEQGQKLHERCLVELELIHIQLDELWADVKH
jgi:transposase-like protein